jgi:hypothetical protein
MTFSHFAFTTAGFINKDEGHTMVTPFTVRTAPAAASKDCRNQQQGALRFLNQLKYYQQNCAAGSYVSSNPTLVIISAYGRRHNCYLLISSKTTKRCCLVISMRLCTLPNLQIVAGVRSNLEK